MKKSGEDNLKTKLPNLFVPGAGKSGTSTLHLLLNKHPEISMSSMKEPHFWSNPEFDNFRKADWEEYLSLFKDRENTYFGESSTGYLSFPDFKINIKKHYKKDPKFIIILRNPIDRIYSHYWWLKGLGSETKDFRAAILEDIDIEPDQSKRLREGGYKNYYQFGLYGKWIEKMYSAFDRENFLIISYEKLKENQLETLNQCFKFLKLPLMEEVEETYDNKTSLLRYPSLYRKTKLFFREDHLVKKILKPFFPEKVRTYINENLHRFVFELTASQKKYPILSIEERKWLYELYKDDVIKLKNITGIEFTEWEDFD